MGTERLIRTAALASLAQPKGLSRIRPFDTVPSPPGRSESVGRRTQRLSLAFSRPSGLAAKQQPTGAPASIRLWPARIEEP